MSLPRFLAPRSALSTALAGLLLCGATVSAQAAPAENYTQVSAYAAEGVPGYDSEMPYSTSVAPEHGQEAAAGLVNRESVEAQLDTVARSWQLGEPREPVTGLDGGYWSKTFTHGTVVFSPGYGAIPLAQEVYQKWLHKERNIWGAPVSSEGSTQQITTRFTNGAYTYHSASGLVRSANKPLGQGDALVLGDSQVFDTSWVGSGISQAGFRPTFFRCGGVGYLASAPGVCSSYSGGVLNNEWYLPVGNPSVIYVHGSGNDVWFKDTDTMNAARQTIQKLKIAYPNSRIIMSDIFSQKIPDQRVRAYLGDRLREVAREEKVTFLSVKYWVTDYQGASLLADRVHLSDAGHKVYAPRFAASFRQAAQGYTLVSAIGLAHANTGGTALYGVPTSNEFAISGGVAQIFGSKYSFYWSERYGAHPVYFWGAIGAKYRAADYQNGYGLPTMPEHGIAGGAVQRFGLTTGQTTAIYWSASSGKTHAVWEAGSIGNRYNAGGGSGAFGFPVEDETAYAYGARQVFENGSRQTHFYWSKDTGTHLMNGLGSIFAQWANSGGAHTLGFPSTEEQAVSNGSVQFFKTASGAETGIWWSPASGSHKLNSRGALYRHWVSNGYTRSLGFPTTDEQANPDGSYSVTFTSGVTLKWTARGGVQTIR